MSIAAEATPFTFPHRHLLGIQGLSRNEITSLLDLAEDAAELNPVSYTHLTLPTTPYV